MIEEEFERFEPNEEGQWYGVFKKSPYHLDFLYFFVGEKNLATSEIYSQDYLDYLKRNWQIEKKISNDEIQQYPNLWYQFTNGKENFLELSSKVKLTKKIKSWNVYQHEVYVGSEFELDLSKSWYLKADYGFAGRGNRILELHGKTRFDSTKEVVIEEFLDRKIDFSIMILDDHRFLIYQNKVSISGQYQETVIDFSHCFDIEKFLLKFGVESEKIDEFKEIFLKLVNYFQSKSSTHIQGSFDFFIYKSKESLAIHPCCEFNPRWTMGRVAWHIATLYNNSKTKFFSSCFASKILDGYQLLSPANSKMNFQVKWYNE